MKKCTECFEEWDSDILVCPECGSLQVQDDFEDDDEDEDDAELERQRMTNHYWRNKGI